MVKGVSAAEKRAIMLEIFRGYPADDTVCTRPHHDSTEITATTLFIAVITLLSHVLFVPLPVGPREVQLLQREAAMPDVLNIKEVEAKGVKRKVCLSISPSYMLPSPLFHVSHRTRAGAGPQGCTQTPRGGQPRRER